MNAKHPLDTLTKKALLWKCSLEDKNFADKLDEEDEMSRFRDMFYYPKKSNLYSVDAKHVADPEEECIYFCGHSLGLMSKMTDHCVKRELDKWGKIGIEGHTKGDLPWASCDELLVESTAKLVGALSKEVALLNSLTVNEHLLLVTFYQPTKEKYKILMESQAFPSDHYCIESQIRQRGLDPKECMIVLKPRKGEHTIRHEDILDVIEREGDKIAVILFGGVQYYTGQLFNMAEITKAGHAKGCYVGFDLAHAVGNVPLNLHEWDVDFACWCTYKYLCSGAGGLGGMYINEKFENHNMPQFLGWWGHKQETRFLMTNEMDLIPGPFGYRISNPPGLLAASLQGGLHVYDQTTMQDFRQKSLLLTSYFEYLLLKKFGKNRSEKTSSKMPEEYYIDIITPSNPEERGCQLSLTSCEDVTLLYKKLSSRGVLFDKREPNVLRLSFNPFYNTFNEIYKFMNILEECIEDIFSKENLNI